ncbi:unnamed protein product [Mytilus edulis]|uniref:Uncharacterized protein n=1 Tax=Mytilus edulis TaxID=6550 RepID=A0A8S3QI20_MYTED|nr:unnamed protein product [Mytilus edulis]
MASAALKGLQKFETENNITSNSIFENNSIANNMIYEICKAFISMSGCQKSGDALDFNDYLASINEKNYLVTFLHNRFNILFVDGGTVYHRGHINNYLTSGRCSKTNKLISSISTRIENETLLSECRALGIIEKLICGPLWRILEDDKISFFEMNAYWQILIEKIDKLSNDASELLKGNQIFHVAGADILKKDVIYDCLFETYDKFDALTLQAL